MLMRSPLARDRQTTGLCPPCKPVLSLKVPIGPEWIHELKHDGFRIVAHKDGDIVRLWSRNGRDWSVEFVAITAAVMALPVTRIVLDGKAVAHCLRFHALLSRSGTATACLYAFDLLHLGPDDLRPLALSERRALLRKHLKRAGDPLQRAPRRRGLGGDVPARLRDGARRHRLEARHLPLKSGSCLRWVKVKNPAYERRSLPTCLPYLCAKPTDDVGALT